MNKDRKSASRLPRHGTYTAIPNSYLDAIVSNRSLSVRQRFEALLMRTSWGNFSDFACDRVFADATLTGPPIRLRPLSQVDMARILKVSNQAISDLVREQKKRGLMRTDPANPRLLIPNDGDDSEKAAGA